MNGSRSEALFTCINDAFDGKMFHAAIVSICAGWLEVASARLVGFDDRAESVQFKLVLVEDIVEQDDLLAKADGNVHGHRDARDDEVALINEMNELLQREMSEGTLPWKDGQVFGSSCVPARRRGG